MSSDDGLVPLDQAFFEAHRATGVKVNADLWDLLRGAGLVRPGRRIKGSRTYGISRPEVERFITILVVKKQLRGRFLMSKLGFELAVGGNQSVPTRLVVDEIERRLGSAFGVIRRSLTRVAGIPSRLDGVNDEHVQKGARRIAKRLMRSKRRHSRHRTYVKTLETFFSIFLGAIYLGKRATDFTWSVEDLLSEYLTYRSPKKGLVGDPNQRELARQLIGLLSTMHSWLYHDERRNMLFRDLRNIEQDQLQTLITVTPRIVNAIIDSARDFAGCLAPPAAANVKRMVGSAGSADFFAALCLAGLIGGREDPSVQELIQQAFHHNLTRVSAIFDSLRELVPMLIRLEEVRDARREMDFPKPKKFVRGR